MSFNINSDKEFIRGSKPKLVGDNELTIRGGSGTTEREILRTQLDANTGLPRVGINRTGERINNIAVTAGGTGYTTAPSVQIGPPDIAGGVQALASAFIFNGRVVNIAVNNPGSGYTQVPTVTIVSNDGNGGGAEAEAFRDTVDYELDINGAIRTSTSIISDTARVLNLDIDNFVTPDLELRGPNLKTYMNGTGTPWQDGVIIQENSYRYFGANVYQALNTGQTGTLAPEHTDGIELNGEVQLKHIGFRVSDINAFGFGETGEAGAFPRSITPLLGDRSDKIATTEYVLNLATNDVGGRIYVSEQIGNDLNDGRSAVNPVRTIKKAAQLAWQTPGVKETLVVSGGDYLEDNPISLPPDCSIVGDNLRLVIIRPKNPGKHIVKFGDKNYVIGVTYRDQIDANGDPVATWDFAMVFDDKQRVLLDYEANGDFGVDFPVGHQIFGPDKFRVGFQQNGGLSQLVVGTEVVGVNTGARAIAIRVDFNDLTGPNAYIDGDIDIQLTSGSFVEGEQFRYITSASPGNIIAGLNIIGTGGENKFVMDTDPTGIIAGGSFIQLTDPNNSTLSASGFYEVAQIEEDDEDNPTEWTVTVVPLLNSEQWNSIDATETDWEIRSATPVSYTFDTISLVSIRAEGEVVEVNEDITTTLPIQFIDFSKQGTFVGDDGDGVNSETFGSNEDLGGIVFYTNALVGRSNIHNFKEGEEVIISGLPTNNSPDISMLNGKQRIYKVLEDADGRSRRFVIAKKIPGINDTEFDPGQTATVGTFTRSVTLSLLNSPNTFPVSTPVARRFQDACVFLRNNREFIADEVVRKINDQFKTEYYSVYDISGNSFKIFLGILDHPNTYDNTNPTGTVTFGGVSYDISNFSYDALDTGIATVTTTNTMPLSEDDIVQLAGLEISCEAGTKIYPSYSSPASIGTNGDEQCREDIIHFMNALVRDLEYGSNHNIIEAASKYIVDEKVTYIEDEIIQITRAIEYARELAIFAMRNWRTGDGTPAQPVYAPVYSNVPRYFDDTVITSTATQNADGTASDGTACADVRSAIDTLAYLWVDIITNNASGTNLDAAYSISRNRDLIADEALSLTEASFPALALNDIDQRKCRRDSKYIIDGFVKDLVLGGNAGTLVNAEQYYSGTTLTGIQESELGATRFAFQQVRDLCIAAMRGWKDASGAAYTTSSPIPQFVDSTILADPAGNPLCAGVESALQNSWQLLDDILLYAIDTANGTAPGATTINHGTLYDASQIITYPDSFVYDLNNNRMAIRGDFDDYPIIEASPYTQNSSVISFLGGSGALVDGSKVKQPNCPFPGLELDQSATFPNQGKSMVASAFTIVSFGGTGYKVIEDGYTQLVSVFVIFCADGVLAESGGYCSITNSATNFGIHALRGVGFRREPYVFDIGTVTNVSATPTGRTILTIDGLGREPLEHYVVKVVDQNGDPYTNTSDSVEYFIDSVGAVGAGPPFQAELTIDDGNGQGMNLTNAAGSAGQVPQIGDEVRLHRPSIVNSSSHTWEFAGSGTNYLALPENGGTKDEAEEQVSENYGRVYVSGTDELGDFKVGTFARIENRTGAITFTGTVTISEVEFLKLKGGDVVVTGFSADNTLGGAGTSNSVLPTQKAVRDYITNNLGPYINRPYGTNAVPNQLVQLTESGKISLDQIPALRPFEVYTVADQAERLSIEGALAGDIAIQQDTSTSFILNNDLDSLFLAFQPDPTVQFTLNDIFTGSLSTGRIQATEYRQGVVYQITLTDGGSGYTAPPNVTISGTLQQGGVEARAETTIANGEVVTITIVDYNGFRGGKGYTAAPTVTIAAPAGSGTQAQATALIESRLYGNIVNQIAMTDADTFESSDIPAVTMNITRVVNTSSFSNANWVSLSSNQIAASDITSGVIETDRLASGGVANSFTFLRGDQSYALAVQSIKGAEVRYFDKLYSTANSGSNQLIFQTNSDVLIGHEVVNSVLGIQANTNITGVITAAGLTTISLNNPITQTINAGTIIEFERGASPMVFESTYTQGNFVDDIIIANGGLGFTNGQYFDVEILGGTGTGLKANVVVSGNAVTEITVTDGGTGYNSDFSITNPPVVIGGGSSLVLEAKVSTVNRQYANVSVDIARVTDLTISSDLYGTIGVARYKKEQFNIGTAGNGSVELKTGPNSGLDADLLDTRQGSFYLNSSNQNAGTLPSDRLSGTYNISVSGSSGNTIRLSTGTNNPTSNPTPNNFVEGLVANTINNSADQLNDGGSQHLVLTIRNKGQGLTAEGGVRQMAFTDNDNIWLRGSGTGVTSFGSWGKMWTSLNDGPGTGLDADRLDNKQGTWYQNALNISYGTLSEQRLPRFIEATNFRDSLTIKSYNGDLRLRVYISGQILTTTPFTAGNLVKFYDDLSQAAGDLEIDNLIVNNDPDDNFNDYTIIIGRLTSGNLTTVATAVTIGSASNRVNFDEFSLDDGNTIDVAKLESDGGTANLKLGRTDGTASTNGIYFNTSQVVANYNAAIVSTGGTGTDGDGSINIIVADQDSLTTNSNIIWNAGNVAFNVSNVVSTTSLKSAVMRDAAGDFQAGTITASLTGAASLNVLKAGDTMTGTLNITGAGSNFSVSGTSLLTGIVTMSNDLNVDSGVLFVDVSADEVGVNAGNNPLSTLDVVGNSGILVRPATSGDGAKINFTDIDDVSQQGKITYFHQDSKSPDAAYNESFHVQGTETLLAFKVYGDVIASRRIGINKNNPDRALDVSGAARITEALTIQNTGNGPINFYTNSSTYYWRAGSNTNSNDFFTIEASDAKGGTTFSGDPALAVDGTNNAVAINTTSTSGVDPEDNTARQYTLNIGGDININGLVFQNNAPFVTSRWSETQNQVDIYRGTKVGINKPNDADLTYALDVTGDIGLTGIIYANGVKMYQDSTGIIRSSGSTIAENVNIDPNTVCQSSGDIVIASGFNVTVPSSSVWNITALY